MQGSGKKPNKYSESVQKKSSFLRKRQRYDVLFPWKQFIRTFDFLILPVLYITMRRDFSFFAILFEIRTLFSVPYSQELVCSYDLDQVVNVSIEDDGCLLMLTLSEGGSVRFHVETQRTAWDIKNTIQRGTNGQDIEVIIICNTKRPAVLCIHEHYVHSTLTK